MTDDEPGVPNSDPRHIDPAGDLADIIEQGDLDFDVQNDIEELREFVRQAENGEIDVDPGVEATVRIARTVLDTIDDDE